MRDRLRSFDSKISFFAFADIITAVSGMLIFITLLLATDLGRPSDSSARTANLEDQQELERTLSQQLEADTRNRTLEQLLSAAETAPASEKLEADIARLRADLAQEKLKHSRVAEQLAAGESAVEARDRTLGLTALKAQIQDLTQEAQSYARQEVEVRKEIAVLDQRLAKVESRLLKLRQWEGKLWLVPDRSSTSKEPILVVTSGAGIKLQRFDHPEQTKEFAGPNTRKSFDSYLEEAKPLDQYFVFFVKPSGIALFGRLVKSAREKGFEVGFDAVEEGKDVYFSTPQVPDDSTPPPAHANSTDQPGGVGYSDPSGTTGAGGGRTDKGTDSGPGPGIRSDGGTGKDVSSVSGAEYTSSTNSTPHTWTGELTNADASKPDTNRSPSTVDSPKNQPPEAPPSAIPAAPKPKRWWQRFVAWIANGFK